MELPLSPGRADLVVHGARRSRPEFRGYEGVASHHIAWEGREACADEISREEEEIAVDVVRFEFRGEELRVEHEAVAGFELDVDQAALALALLQEQGGARDVRKLHAGEVRVAKSDRAAFGNGVVTEYLDAIAPQVARFPEALDHDAESFGAVLPVAERAVLAIGLVGQLRIDDTGRSLESEWILKVEGLARDDVDRACDTALDERSL